MILKGDLRQNESIYISKEGHHSYTWRSGYFCIPMFSLEREVAYKTR